MCLNVTINNPTGSIEESIVCTVRRVQYNYNYTYGVPYKMYEHRRVHLVRECHKKWVAFPFID